MGRRILLASVLAVLAISVRTVGLLNSSMWIDDIWSIAEVTGHSLDLRLEGMTADETYSDPHQPVPASFFHHYVRLRPGVTPWTVVRDESATEILPPLYSVFLHLWMRVFGFSPMSGRMFSVLVGLAIIPLLFFAVRRMVDETTAWFSCLIFILSPFQSQIAVQIRVYTMFGLVALVTAWLAYRIAFQSEDTAESSANTRQSSDLTWLIVLGVIGIALHYYFAIHLFLIGLLLLCQRRTWMVAVKSGLVWTVAIAAAAVYFANQPLITALPWLSQKTPWDPSLLYINAGAAATDLLLPNPDVSLGSVFSTPLLLLVSKVLLVATVTTLIVAAARNLPRGRFFFLLGWFAGTIGVIFVLDMIRKTAFVVIPRYSVGAAFGLYILLGAGLSRLKLIPRVVAASVLVSLLLVGQFALRALPVGSLLDGADFRRGSEEIQRGWQPGDLVIVMCEHSILAVSLAYYLPDPTEMLALTYLPRREAGPLIAPPDTSTLVPRLEAYVAGRKHIWVVRLVPDQVTKIMDDWLAVRFNTVHSFHIGWFVMREMRAK